MEFRGQRIDGKAAALWKTIQAECAKYERFVVEVSEYDELKKTSLHQMKYWHTKVISEYSEKSGESLLKSQWYVKRGASRHLFMLEIDEDMGKRGETLFECQNPLCKNIFVKPAKLRGKWVCPEKHCHSPNIWMFYMLSKTELTIKVFNQILESTWDYMEKCGWPVEKPDPAWREKINQPRKKGA